MSNKSSNELVVNPAPHITGPMSKNRLMQYTFAALLIITVITAILWWAVPCPTDTQISQLSLTNIWQMPLGLMVLINALIAVGVAVSVDALLYKLISDSELNTWSAAVFGLIVTLSFSLGVPGMAQAATDVMPVDALTAPMAFGYVAVISLIGLFIFKKIQGVAGRKFVNPAAAAKFIVLLPFISSLLLVKDHFAAFDPATGTGLGVPLLAGPLGGGTLPVGTNGLGSFLTYLQSCYANPAGAGTTDIYSLMILDKYHGWTGGASSLAVIVVGIALFVIARKYIKWRITASYFISLAIMSLIFAAAFADTDLTIRLLFELFIGSSIFLGFFMATDPATTPFTGTGQIIFGVGLAILTILIQTYMNFFGGSLLALLIMNLTVPLLDRVGIHKPFGR
jgi:Na+-translocating ferredoxin:NAD+ oxidoreductase RnfD subunit